MYNHFFLSLISLIFLSLISTNPNPGDNESKKILDPKLIYGFSTLIDQINWG